MTDFLDVRRRSLRVVAACAALGFALAPGTAAAAAAKRPPKIPLYAPDAEAAVGAQLDQRTWRHDSDAYSLQLQRLDDEGRRRAIEHLSGVAMDPFATRPGAPPAFQAFLVILENRSEESLWFNAAKCWFVPNTRHLESPLDADRVRSLYRTSGHEIPGAWEALDRVLLSGERMLAPGESVRGLLVYRFRSTRIKRFTVDVPLTLTTGEGAAFRAAWRRSKGAS